MLRIVILVSSALWLSACGGASSGATGDVVESPDPGSTRPNILLIISDDQGVDASAQYPLTQDPPITPTLDTLAQQGLVFENVWATP